MAKIYKEKEKITTTLDGELQKLAFDKGIKWSEALAYGVKELANMPFIPSPNEIIEKETETAKIRQLQSCIYEMQKRIFELDDENDKLLAKR